MNVDMRNINRYVKSPDVHYETVGYINSSMHMVQTGLSNTNASGRKYVRFPEKGKIKWHTHPHSDGFWPSFEDLNRGYNDQGIVNVLFTRFGTWLFLGFGRIPDQFHHDLLYHNWYWMHMVLEKRTSQTDWTETEIMTYIDYFVNIANKIGYHIEFVPNFKSMNIDKYTTIVQNRLSRLGSQK